MRFVGPRRSASPAVSAAPATAPSVPPTATKPKSRRPCSGRKRSARKPQKTDTAKRLKMLAQMKNDLGDGEVPGLRREGEERPEEDERPDEDAVDDRDEDLPCEAGDEGAEERVERGGARERPDEEPREGVFASADAHLVAERPDDVVAGEEEEEVGARPPEGGALSFAQLHRPREEGAQTVQVRPSPSSRGSPSEPPPLVPGEGRPSASRDAPRGASSTSRGSPSR